MAGSTATEPGRIAEVTRYFLRLGLLGFGGPVALVGHQDVRKRPQASRGLEDTLASRGRHNRGTDGPQHTGCGSLRPQP